MKKVVALILAAALACGMLAGCGEPKDKTLCLPFGAFSSLDASMDEMVKAEGLIPDPYGDDDLTYIRDYENPIKINDDEFGACIFFFENDRLSDAYLSAVIALDKEDEVKPLYNRMIKYMESIYGEGNVFSPTSQYWDVMSEKGYEYDIEVEMEINKDDNDDGYHTVTVSVRSL